MGLSRTSGNASRNNCATIALRKSDRDEAPIRIASVEDRPMVTLSPTTLPHAAPNPAADRQTDYRLFWRLRASGPWRREEFGSREEAFDRYFYLLGRGAELRWRHVDAPR
jgi:hypothetical protein